MSPPKSQKGSVSGFYCQVDVAWYYVLMPSSAPSNEWTKGSPVSAKESTKLVREALAVVLVRNQREADRLLEEMLRETSLGGPMTGADDSDDSEHSSDSDILEGEPPGEGDDPTGGEDRNQVRTNINHLRGENVMRTTTETRRFKEHDTLKVPTFTTLPNPSAWELQVGKNLVAAGGRIDQREIAWWAEANKGTSSFDTLEDSGEDRFVSFDLKLSISLSVALKEVNDEVTSSTAQREHAAAMQGRMLKGRQIARLIFNFFQRNPNMGVICSVAGLAKLEWMGD